MCFYLIFTKPKTTSDTFIAHPDIHHIQGSLIPEILSCHNNRVSVLMFLKLIKIILT